MVHLDGVNEALAAERVGAWGTLDAVAHERGFAAALTACLTAHLPDRDRPRIGHVSGYRIRHFIAGSSGVVVIGRPGIKDSRVEFSCQ